MFVEPVAAAKLCCAHSTLGPVAAVVAAAEALESSDILTATKILEKAFEGVKTVLEAVAACKKPSLTTELQELVKPVADQIMASDQLLKGEE